MHLAKMCDFSLLPADMLVQRFGSPTETLRDMMRRGVGDQRLGVLPAAPKKAR